MATFPQFYALEQRYGSLIGGIKQTRSEKKAGNKPPEGAFFTLKSGLQSIVRAIEEQLPYEAIVKNTALERIEKCGNGYTLYLDHGRTVETQAIILALPHRAAYRSLKEYAFLQPLEGSEPTSLATVLLGFDASAVLMAKVGTGFLVPRTAGFTITACTWTHVKWPHTAPEGKALLRSYVGRAGDDAIVGRTDEDIVQAVIADLSHIMTLKGRPELSRVTRWKNAMPQYVVGHAAWWKNVQAQLPSHLPGVFLAGASYEGVGVPDCIAQGKKAADSAVRYMTERRA